MRALPRSTPVWMIAAALSGDVIVIASNCAAISSRLRPSPAGSRRTRALRAMFVVMPPGGSVIARTALPASSCRSDSVKPRAANFAAQYALWYGTPNRPYTLEVLTIAPSPCSTRIGRNARVPCTTPRKLMSCSQSSSSGTASSTLEVTATPALLKTAASGAGSHSRTSPANFSWSSASRTSSTRVSTRPCSAAAVAFSPSASTSAKATGEPRRDSRVASARPMPDAAPVITTGRPTMLRGRDTAAPHVLVDEVEDRGPRARGQVVAHAADGFEAGAGDGAGRGGAAGGVDHPVAVAVDHQRRCGDLPQPRRPVAGLEDRAELAAHAARRRVAVPARPGPFAH